MKRAIVLRMILILFIPKFIWAGLRLEKLAIKNKPVYRPRRLGVGGGKCPILKPAGCIGNFEGRCCAFLGLLV